MAKNMRFEMIKDTGKTKVFEAISTHGKIKLGRIGWYPQWRQYVFVPFKDTLYSWDCMQEIMDKIRELMEERKHKNRIKKGD